MYMWGTRDLEGEGKVAFVFMWERDQAACYNYSFQCISFSSPVIHRWTIKSRFCLKPQCLSCRALCPSLLLLGLRVIWLVCVRKWFIYFKCVQLWSLCIHLQVSVCVCVHESVAELYCAGAAHIAYNPVHVCWECSSVRIHCNETDHTAPFLLLFSSLHLFPSLLFFPPISELSFTLL